jgi:hypothetical protein
VDGGGEQFAVEGVGLVVFHIFQPAALLQLLKGFYKALQRGLFGQGVRKLRQAPVCVLQFQLRQAAAVLASQAQISREWPMAPRRAVSIPGKQALGGEGQKAAAEAQAGAQIQQRRRLQRFPWRQLGLQTAPLRVLAGGVGNPGNRHEKSLYDRRPDCGSGAHGFL